VRGVDEQRRPERGRQRRRERQRRVARQRRRVHHPGTQVPFEAGGADGSGADGSERPQARGGVGGGADTDEPGDRPGADREIKPPRGGDPDADG
jgi:hypothetical protein